MYLKPLIKKLIVDEETIEQVMEFNTDEELIGFLVDIITIEEIETAFTHHYGVIYNKLDMNTINQDLINNFDIELLQKECILPYYFEEDNKRWHFAISDLTNKDIQRNITKVVNQKKQSVLFTFAFKHEIEAIYGQLSRLEKPVVVNESTNFNATDWVQMVINKGIQLKASDIHIERQEVGIKVRYRVDGSMTNKKIFNVSANEISNIYVRLKIIGNMDIVEKRRSQDGRIDNYEFEDNLYDLRVSTLNTIHGEKFVMRIFSKEDKTVNFNDLGFSKKQEETVLKMIKKNNGIIYLAGATGAGKTTTLYAMIDELDKEKLNIYTVENPVEKGIIDVNQVQVDDASGNTYPSVLQTLLRQDPDIIVIGEIRETQTSQLAVRASLTGHLVMTTIHANNALDSLSRLEDMGVESYLIGASSIGFMSQRLVKLLCPKCKEKVETIPDYQEIWIKEEMPDFNYEKHKMKEEYLYKAKGCNSCIEGYSGRLAVVEIITVDEPLRSMISRQATSDEIKEYLDKIGYENMKHDGIMKSLNGVISIDELIVQLQN